MTRRERIEAMLRDDPSDPFLWYGLAMEQAGSEPEAALKTFAELRARFPDYVPGYVQAGQLLAKQGRDDILMVVGGVIPPQDFQALRDAGAAAIFPPGTVIAEAAIELLDQLNRQLGYTQA